MNIQGYGGDMDGMLYEYLHATVHPHVMEQVSTVQFDDHEELLWALERGGIYSYIAPSMERYSCVSGHTSRVQDMTSSPAGVISVSAEMLRLHSSGGVPLLTYRTPTEQLGTADMHCCAADIHSARAFVGRKDNVLAIHDLGTGKIVAKSDTPGEVITACYPGGRGLVIGGCLNGSVVLCDPRSQYRVEGTIIPHAGGVTTLDAKGDLLATAGMSVRMGQLVLDSLVQVYDIRHTPRAVFHIPFGAGPTMLAFHPKFTSTVVVGSSVGTFVSTDVQGTGFSSSHQVNCEGDMVTASSISSSGELSVYGTASSYLHLWATTDPPRVNHYSRPTEIAAVPRGRLEPTEDEPANFALYPSLFCMEGRPMSMLDDSETMSVGLAPRIVDTSFLKGLKQVDFVGYVSNPYYSRSRKPGESGWLTSPLRNKRVTVGLGKSDKSLERTSSKGLGPLLPARYHKMEIRQLQSHVKFEEFDFSFYNRTKFAGLENSMANCYCNPLLQVLYFLPMMRGYILQHVPDPDREFSLTCEASFLFRMMRSVPEYSAGGTCQPLNLLRSLRQSREASMLGLLETHKNEPRVQNTRGDIEVETNKERSLSRRVQSFSRFVLEHLHREVLQPGSSTSAISDVFGLEYLQRIKCLSGTKAEQLREGRSFQLELQYPPVDIRPNAAEPASLMKKNRPAFSSLLAKTLMPETEMRAWFDDKHKYQMVRQTRIPTKLPDVLVVSCGNRDRSDVNWWLPVTDDSGTEKSWLPWAVEIEAMPGDWELHVIELSAADMAARVEAGSLESETADSKRAVYALTAVVVHVQEEDDQDEDGKTGGEGHVVAHVKVLPHDFHPILGIASPALSTSTAGLSPLVTRSSPIWESAALAATSAAKTPEKLSPLPAKGTSLESHSLSERSSAINTLSGCVTPKALSCTPPLAPGGATAASGLSLSAERMPSLTRGTSVDLSPMANVPMKTGNLLGRGWAGYAAWEDGWLIHNDFCIVPSSGDEVMRLYGTQKMPCILYYTKVSAINSTQQQPADFPVSETMDLPDFHRLCNAPPMQGAQAQLEACTFVPLDINTEPPKKGMLLAIDAEFVMFSPEEKLIVRGVETVTRPARLGLARISVLRGDPGPNADRCCIDDYVRTVEPVYDYLTRFSGLVHGDLDPSTSKHHLTTLKRAYMKLRYLVDSGCIFIGHGLKKDFRMINITVPPEQVIDTVELFHFKRQRKLSLRFLASYLLKIDIQQQTHDSIEDARTALKLFQAYRELAEANRVQEKMLEMYRWGKQHGWEPAQWPGTGSSQGPPPPPPPSS